ncbi:C-type lectin domain family 4 member E-like [Labeo rohita]|uniref:C-type lectin domain family 4 member E-like n=1 Tax=Labeo rohita TaxID=84645 RepID=UPI0021E2BE7D|nr:C-type lectin domain family 4 member E-like [Labeo rohita]
MDLVYENSSFILSTVASAEKPSQCKGNSTKEQESERDVYLPKWTKVLLIVFAVCLLFAIGGLCILARMYVSVSVQLSVQKTNGTIMARELEELTANYTTVIERLSFYEVKVSKTEELTSNYTSIRERLSFYEAFTVKSLNCNVSLTDFHRKLYFFSSNKMNWSSSRAFCVSKGADLVTITSQTEQRFLASKITEWHWLGVNDLETEGHWVWVNNQTLSETGIQFWYKRTSEKSEPDNWKEDDHNGENCAIVKNDVNYLDSWFDVSCNYEMKFICEKKY